MTIFGDPLWAELLSIANACFSLILALLCFKQVPRWSGYTRLMLIVCGLIGLYWFVLYVFVVFTPSGSYNPVTFGQVFVRPAFTFTLAIMASVALYRWRINRRL